MKKPAPFLKRAAHPANNTQPFPPFQGFEAVARRFENLKLDSSRKGGRAWCPVHQGDGKSHRDSRTLSLRETPDGAVQVTCFAGCEHRAILHAVGLHYVDLLPDHQRRAGHDYSQRTPEDRAKYLEWDCRKHADALIVPVNILRIVANRIIDALGSKAEFLAATGIPPQSWQQFRKAHHDVTEILGKIGGRAHG